jgi:hypothetical protein
MRLYVKIMDMNERTLVISRDNTRTEKLVKNLFYFYSMHNSEKKS